MGIMTDEAKRLWLIIAEGLDAEFVNDMDHWTLQWTFENYTSRTIAL